MDVNTTSPSAMIIAFVPRRERPRVGIAILGMSDGVEPLGQLFRAANSDHAHTSDHGGAP